MDGSDTSMRGFRAESRVERERERQTRNVSNQDKWALSAGPRLFPRAQRGNLYSAIFVSLSG